MLQYVNINDSKVKFVNESDNPENRLSDAEKNIGEILFDAAMDKIKADEIESTQAEMLLEIAQLKMGGVA